MSIANASHLDLVLKVEACLSLCSAARKRHNAQEAPVPRFHFHFHFVLPFYFFLYDHRCLGRPPLSPCSAAVSLSHTACLRAASMCLVRRDAERRRSPWKSAEIKRAESIAMPIGRRASPPADLADTQNRVRMSAFGVMQTYYSQGFLDNMSPSAISWIGSVQLFLDLALAAPGGDLLDKGYFRHTVVAGSVIFVICPHQYYQVFLAQGLGMGIGIGLVYLSTSVIVTQHFKQNKSLAMGVVMSGGSLGGFVFSVALNYLLHSSMTFGWTMRLSAFFCLGLLFLGNLLMFEPHPSKDNLARTDQADTSSIIDEKVLGKIRQDSIQTTNLNDQSTRQGSIYDAKYLCFLGMGFLTGLGKWFPTYYVQLFAEQHGVSQQLSFYALAVMNISNMLGRIFPNWLGDRWSPFDVYMVCLLCAGGVEFSMLACSTSYGLILFIIIYGFFLGTSISLYLPAVASLSNEKAREGKRMGLALVPVGVSSLIGTPISGAILGPDYDWWKGVVFSSRPFDAQA
ncbi:hypothetical protein IEO21_04281 [Rhodonia placenta]|uniref:Major facilitator superfamily (MFS) profile domain-containing protein n=1 Tax=Rhodonia placenta TaxID=104341 RepID=A0A8H7U3D7_9APHY|nr:hypothetical protein IEO21_04281 [Postia placenta]